MESIDNRGQAAVTDALYFLLIVTGLCVFLYTFANSYGITVTNQISRQYGSDFATGALKTILYSSLPRDPTHSLYTKGVEVDSLLAYLKEDYSDDHEVDDDTKIVLGRNIQQIMMPFSDNYDYIFYIWKPAEDKFIFVFSHVSKFSILGEKHFRKTAEPGEPAHVDYFCSPENIDREMIDKLILGVSGTSQASSKVIMLEQEGIRDPLQKEGQVDLVLWPATDISSHFDPDDIDTWNCESFTELRERVLGTNT